MNKTYKLTALWMMCLILLSGLSFTACNDGDEESTNQYTGGISLNVFGPSPVARGGILRFLGNGMDQVTGVVIPGCSEITDIDVISKEEIHVTVPQTAEPGYVTLNTPIGAITTKTKLTYSEPISLESFSPTSIKAGTTLVIKGEYLNLIQEVIFANSVIVPATEFISQSRAEIKVVVPNEAQTGKLIISDTSSEDTESIPNWIYSDNELNIILPSVAEIADLSEKKPGDEITLTGNDLDLITKVIMPNGDEVEFTVDGDKLTFFLPDNISDGSIIVTPASGVEVVFATIGVALPSEVVAEPATELRAGDKITLTGKNMELITDITFPGVTDAVSMDSQTETEVTVTMPGTAISGNLLLNTQSGVSVEVAITTQKPVFESFANDAVALAGQVTIQGQNMDLVTKVTFSGGAEVTELSTSAAEVTLTMPSMQVETGVLTLTMANGESVETSSLTINAPEACYIPVLPGEDVELKGGEVWIIEVGNSDKLTNVQIDGKEVDYLINGNTLYINVPQTANANSMVKFISSNGVLEYAVAFIPATEIKNSVWSGMTEITWGEGGRVVIPASAFKDVPAGAKMILHYQQKQDVWAQAQINYGNWNAIDFTEGEFLVNGTLIPTDIYGWVFDSRSTPLVLTQEILDNIQANQAPNNDDLYPGAGIIIQGSDLIFTQITLEWEISLESTIWESEFVCSGWNGNQDLAWGGYDWTTVKAGSIIRFYYSKNPGWGCISLRHGDSWGALPSPIPGQYDFADDSEGGVLEVELPQNVLDDIIDNGGMVLTGDNYTLNKITIE